VAGAPVEGPSQAGALPVIGANSNLKTCKGNDKPLCLSALANIVGGLATLHRHRSCITACESDMDLRDEKVASAIYALDDAPSRAGLMNTSLYNYLCGIAVS